VDDELRSVVFSCEEELDAVAGPRSVRQVLARVAIPEVSTADNISA